MKKKQFRGEYLAPKVKVMEVGSHSMLCVSTNIDFGDDNPFDGNKESDWAKFSDDADWSFDEFNQ